MISEEVFDRIIKFAYEGYGASIKDGQLRVMYTQLGHLEEAALKSACKQHLRNEKYPPKIADILKFCGGNPADQQQAICPSCGNHVDHLVAVGHGEARSYLCGDCWYTRYSKLCASPTWSGKAGAAA